MEQPVMTPPINDEAMENKLVSLALQQAKQQFEDGTASSQITVHFLRLGSQRAQVEIEKLQLENNLLEEKIQSERQGQELTEMFGEVLEAIKSYSYIPPGESDVDLR